MGSGRRRIFAGIVSGLVGYLLVLPIFWPHPTASAVIPETVSLKQSADVEVTVHAWHSNVDVSQVRFYTDGNTSTAKGPNGPFYPVILLEARPREFRGFLATNLFTRPWSKRLTLTLPLREWVEQGLVGPGTLAGKLDVTLHFAAKGRRSTSTRQRTEAIPFQIAVSE